MNALSRFVHELPWTLLRLLMFIGVLVMGYVLYDGLFPNVKTYPSPVGAAILVHVCRDPSLHRLCVEDNGQEFQIKEDAVVELNLVDRDQPEYARVYYYPFEVGIEAIEVYHHR